MQVAVLGPVEVRLDDRPVAVSGARVRRLLVRLAVDAPRVVSMSELEEAVWFDGDIPREAANAVQSLVSRLRRALGDPGLVEQAPSGYRLVRADTDLAAFERAARAGRAALERGDLAEAILLLRPALDSWRGDALVDAGDAPYAFALAARLNEAHAAALSDRIDADLGMGRGADLVGELEELSAAMPLRERLTGQLMRVLVAAGRSAEALAVFAKARERLASELGAEPSQPLQEVHLAVLRGEVGSPPRATPRPGPALRAALTTFVGRDEEVSRIHGLLSNGRLTTIVGPGGAGKTRLAGEAVRGWETPTRWDGSWLVELAPISEEANLVQGFLTALGVREARMAERPTDRAVTRDPMTRLLESLGDTSCLLVVDNCEHLLEGVAQLVAQLLSSCPHVRVLATSREPLGIDGESLCVVPPLALPTPGTGPEHALLFPSVRLLFDRATAVSAGFEVNEVNVTDVVEIVRRLDGLPLAIELAAARLRVLPVSEVAARLSDRFRLLTGGNRAAMPRHQTLRAVVEWSWDLLVPRERLLAERLAVFPAGVDLPGATAVCAGDGIGDAAEIPDLLDSLVDKSLLQVSNEGGLRYRMLETIREYGAERLVARDEVERMRLTHARYFAAVVAEAAPLLRGRDQLASFATIEREYDNILAGLRFLGDSGEAAETLALAVDLSWYWMFRNEHSDAHTWLAFACSVPGGEGSDLHILAQVGSLLNELADDQAFESESGSETLERLEIFVPKLQDLPDLGERFEPGRRLMAVGGAFFSQQEDGLEGLLGEGLGSSDPCTRAATRMFRAAVAENRGDVEQMRDDVAIALADFRDIGDRWGLASTLSSSGYLLMLEGDLAGAGAAYSEAAGLMDELGATADGGFMWLQLAGLRVRQGEFEDARRLVQEVIDRAAGRPGPVTSFATALLASIAALAGDVVTMRRLRETVVAGLGNDRGTHPVEGHGRAITLATVAQLYADDGELATARGYVLAAYSVAVSTRDQPIIAMVGVSVAAIASGLGLPELAARMLGACAVLRGGDDPSEPHQARLAEHLRILLGNGFRECFDGGRTLTHDEARAAVDPELLTDPVVVPA